MAYDLGMEGRFDWHEPAHVRGRESFLPAPDRVGWWMVISLSVAIVLHIILFISLGHLKMGFGWTNTEEINTGPVVVRPVEEDLPAEIPLRKQKHPHRSQTARSWWMTWKFSNNSRIRSW